MQTVRQLSVLFFSVVVLQAFLRHLLASHILYPSSFQEAQQNREQKVRQLFLLEALVALGPSYGVQKDNLVMVTQVSFLSFLSKCGGPSSF